MAYYNNELDEQQQQDPNAIPAGQTTSPGSGVISGQGASSTAGAAATNAAPTNVDGSPSGIGDRSGNFVGLQDYLKANKPQSSKLGTQVAGQVQSTIQGAQEDVSQLNPRFNQIADQGQISNIGGAAQEAESIVQGAAGAPAGQGLGGKERFGEIANAQYQGPNALIDTELYAPTYQKVQQAQNYANLSKDESGSGQLLKDLYKTPTYSAGENLFDTYLLNTQENKQKLQSARQNAENLDQDFAAANEQAAAYAADQRAKAEQVRQQARQALEGTRDTRSKEIEQDLAGIAASWNDEQNAYANALFNSNEGKNLVLTDEMMQKLGVDSNQRIYNILKGKTIDDIKNQYVTMEAFDPNRVISKDQQAQLAALDELAGTFGGALTNKYTQAEIAGTLDKATAFAAKKFGLTAKEAEKAFNAAAEITKRTAQVSSERGLDQKQSLIVGREITEKIVENLPWPLSDIVRWVTRTVYDTVSVNVRVGNASANTISQGTVADYLAGRGPSTGLGSYSAALDWGAFMDPTGALTGSYMAKLDDIVGQLNRENSPKAQQAWTNQILQYLQQEGYNNVINRDMTQVPNPEQPGTNLPPARPLIPIEGGAPPLIDPRTGRPMLRID